MAEFSVFRDGIKRVCPPWLQGNWGYRLMYSIGIQIDAVAETLKQGVLARMPGYGTAEALGAIGNDKQIQQGVGESNDAFIVRLQQALDIWKIAGNAQSVIFELLGYVSPATPRFRYVVGSFDTFTTWADWITVEAGSVSYHRASPSNFVWDGFSPAWRFWLIVYSGIDAFDARKVWGDGHTYGDGTAWGYDGSPDLVNDMRNIVKKFKAAGSNCEYIIATTDAGAFDPTAAPGAPMPDGTWGNPANRDPDSLYFPVGL